MQLPMDAAIRELRAPSPASASECDQCCRRCRAQRVGEVARTRRRRHRCTDKAGLDVAVCCRRRAEGESEGQGEGALDGTAKALGDDGADENRRMSREGDTAGAGVVKVEMSVTRLDGRYGRNRRRDGIRERETRWVYAYAVAECGVVQPFPAACSWNLSPLLPLSFSPTVRYLKSTLDEHRALAVLEQGSRLTQTDRPGAGDCG